MFISKEISLESEVKFLQKGYETSEYPKSMVFSHGFAALTKAERAEIRLLTESRGKNQKVVVTSDEWRCRE